MKTTNVPDRIVAIAVLLLAAQAMNAQSLDYRVAFAEVPGIEDIDAGRYDRAIKRLEKRRADPDVAALEDELATLCGTYIISGRWRDAGDVCDRAVEADRSHIAYNNRGVLRAQMGDIEGALRDFARLRVPDEAMAAYIDALKRDNVRLIATNNFELTRALQARRQAESRRSSGVQALRGADIEMPDPDTR